MVKTLRRKDLARIMDEMPEAMSPRDVAVILSCVVRHYGMEDSFPMIIAASAFALGLTSPVDKSMIN